MSDFDIESEVNERLENLIEAIIVKKISDLLGDPDQVAKRVTDSYLFKSAINDFIDKRVPSLVGDRLRLGCYDKLRVDRAFADVWDKKFDEAIDNRIRDRVDERIKVRINSFLSEILGKIKV